MKINSLLMTSAATLMATSVAYAADLPSKKAAPSAGSVQVCKVAGKTGFSLPGSDTCVVLSGYVWAEAIATNGSGKLSTASATDSYSTGLREQLNIDALTNTEMGVLTSHASFRFTQSGQSVLGGMSDNSGRFSTIVGGGSAGIDSAYAQLGGFKVGYFGSTFGMMDGSPSYEAPNNSPSNTVMQAGYSAALGNGVTLGIAVEDVRSKVYYSTAVGYAPSGQSYTSVQGPIPGQARMPDIVGTLDFSTGAADIHLGAVYHDIYSTTNDPYNEDTVDEDYNGSGWAFDAGLTFKLDSIAKGDTLKLEYTYVDGAGARISGHSAASDANAWETGYVWTDVAHADSFDRTTGSNYAASFNHNFSPKLSMNLFGAYSSVDVSFDETYYNQTSTLVGANLDYQPVKNFHIQPEVWYQHVTNDYASYSGSTTDKGSGSAFTGMLRIKRDF